jgi:hypothetical protein
VIYITADCSRLAIDQAVKSGEQRNPTAMEAWDRRMDRLSTRWNCTLEAEAVACEYRLSKHRQSGKGIRQSLPTVQDGDVSARTIAAAGAVHGPVETDSSELALTSTRPTKSTRPGPRAKRSESFVICAGTLWREATCKTGNVSIDKLREVATALDTANYLPPAGYLEGKYAREVKDFNSRNSNSKIGPLLTWSRLVSHGDKHHVQGMRRLLSRCAQKIDDHPVSGINGGQKISS